jgi:hypothetical protein
MRVLGGGSFHFSYVQDTSAKIKHMNQTSQRKTVGSVRLVIFRINKSQEVPTRASPLRHSVGVTAGWGTSAGVSGLQPLCSVYKGALWVP